MSHHIRARAFAVAAAALALVPASAGAQAAAPTAAGGATAEAAAPVLDAVTCRMSCTGVNRVRSGSAVRLTGEGLDGVSQVLFRGKAGRKDDKFGQIAQKSATTVDVIVPKGARSGAVVAISAEGEKSGDKQRVTVAGAKGAPALQARVDRRQVFVGGAQKASVSFFVGGTRPAAVAVALVKKGTEDVLASWNPGIVPQGTVGSVEWDGLINGVPAPEATYVFRVLAAGGSTAGAQAAQAGPATASSAFRLLAHRFPVAGPHTYGTGAASFGGGRGHEGHDVFAKCGTPLVAASGGTVKHVAFHGNAGNYVVIAAADGYDHAYMHLQRPTTLKKGAKVATGDPVGAVGDTGRANGCHLHFEVWEAPGWYTGGKPVDPLPFLKAWDTAA